MTGTTMRHMTTTGCFSRGYGWDNAIEVIWQRKQAMETDMW